MRRSIAVAVLVLCPVLALAQAQPQPAPAAAAPAAAPAPVAKPVPVPPPEPEHRGFFLRLDGGVGYLSSSASALGTTFSMSGFAIPFGISVGAAVVPNFIIAGDIWGTLGVSPTLSGGGASTTAGDASFSLVGFGVQLTYYFMPANVYVSVTPSLGLLTVTDSSTNSSGSAQPGFAGKVAIGKEWWVGRKWGLGVAGQFHFGVNKDKGTNPPTWTTLGGGVAFSVTYN